MGRLLAQAFRLNRRIKRMIQIMADIFLLSASFILALILKTDSVSALAEPQAWLALLLALPITLLIFIRLGFYRAVIRYMSLRALHTLAFGIGLSVILLLIAGQLTGLSLAPSFLVIYGILAMLMVGGVRFLLRSLYRNQLIRYKTRVIIYGAGAAGSQLANSLRQGSEYVPVAFVDDWRGMHGTQVEGLWVYPTSKLPELIDNYAAERVLLAMPSVPRSRRRDILQALAPLNVPILTVPGAEDVVSGRAHIQDIRDVAVEDLLGRDPVPPQQELLDANIRDKVVMVTGAGGSIGSELCRQILPLQPRRLLLVDNCEYSLYTIEAELKQLATLEGLPSVIEPLLGSVQQRGQLESAMRAFRVQTLYHAAAYKHVPMVEYNVLEGVRNNVFGTLETARAALSAGVETFVLISTDKAVRPTNVMGTTKRLAELICQALSHTQYVTRFCMVRFGNVLGSSGSVIPLFRKQIAQGGPITVTHEAITRYFMTIPEAATLVLQAGAMGKGGDVFVLDMGSPVKIADLAREMVRLSGLKVRDDANPEGDIEIHFTGLRPGEKLYEELLVGENDTATTHPRILTARESCWEWPRLEALLDRLKAATERGDLAEIRQIMLEAPTSYAPQSPIVDLIWLEHDKNPVTALQAPVSPNFQTHSHTESKALERLKAATFSLLKGPL
ncbi:polysaccharide biosynthesis protein [Halomonas campisalis]|uniref:Polysaccharide biosynthesis protein n=1 Tax=Billgrantia campisalis TaxID=74661 RepID=A0ABS9P3G5_9GAMM|nr:nucleoside-diphosphate sugar epimerase/dehydratase [Halomonas campisalis]MCG6656322.1 polysaccharide biosynthesis protein [Halomonas campisalis]MDR5861508.1 nucleoside-diphosphate sugar epimerase/dehydratase [Halomonas campisalis]